MGFISVYPPAHSSTYIKATTNESGFSPEYVTDPSKNLLGDPTNNAWFAARYTYTNQRLHIDLGLPRAIKRIAINNGHWANYSVWNPGVKNFIFQGSNEPTAFSNLAYAVNTNWNALITIPTLFVAHVSADVVDWQFALVESPTPYRYYAIKCADNWGNTEWIGFRRVELQIEVSGSSAETFGPEGGSI